MYFIIKIDLFIILYKVKQYIYHYYFPAPIFTPLVIVDLCLAYSSAKTFISFLI